MLALSGMAPAQGNQGGEGPPGDFVLARAFWADADGKADFATARAQSYTAYQNVLSRGYTDAVHWVRLTIAASKEPLILRLGPNWLDDLRVFDPAAGVEPVVLGDRHPVANNALPGLGYTVRLPAGAVERDIWVRLQSTSSHFLSAEVQPDDQAAKAATRRILLATLYTAILLVLFFVLLVTCWEQRDPVLIAYLWRHGVFTCYGAGYLGVPALLFGDWLPPLVFDKVFSLSCKTACKTFQISGVISVQKLPPWVV